MLKITLKTIFTSIKKILKRYQHNIPFGVGFAGMLALGWIVFPMVLYKSEPQPIQFNHKMHTGEQVGLACEDCHIISDNGRFLGVPAIAKCAECHSSQIGQSESEKILVENYIGQNKEIPWLIYSRQPDNVYFSHASHVRRAQIKCEECHGPEGQSEQLRIYQVNRISGYSRDIWGENISGIPSHPWDGMKMDRCVHCHENYGRRDGCIECHK